MRVLVVDDTARVRTSLSRALGLEGFEVETASDGAAALEAVARWSPHAVVLDLVMPGIDGLEVCARLREGGHDVPVIMLTVRDGLADRVAGFDAGADDYLGKPFALEELVARLKALMRRAAGPASGERVEFADLVLDGATRQVTRGGVDVELTPTEYELLAFLMAHPRRVLSKGQILEAVWGYPGDTNTNTLEVYVGYLRKKLEDGGKARLIQTVRGVGYVLRAAR